MSSTNTLEDGEQVGIQMVEGIDIVFARVRHLQRGCSHCEGHGAGNRLSQSFVGHHHIPCGFVQHGLIRHGLGKVAGDDVLQVLQHMRVCSLEKTGSKLVQQAADVFRCCIEGLRMPGIALVMQFDMSKRMLQRARHLGQGAKADRRRGATDAKTA